MDLTQSKKMNICIVHYNAQNFTDAAIRSINKFMPEACIYVFDNSDKTSFKNTYNNVTVFDNTKNQLVNFSKELSKYKLASSVNNYASLRHTLSIQKCIDMINDNFILLDSDVIIRKNLIELYDANYLWVGEIKSQSIPKKRVLPFCCFLNVKMMKEKGIKYFDPRYMHGLNITSESNLYDTGAALLVHSTGLPCKTVQISKYIWHYNHGSFDMAALMADRKKKKLASITPDNWIKQKENMLEKHNKVIYTCITNKYDALQDPQYIDSEFDYICFTDNHSLTSDVWEIRYIDEIASKYKGAKSQRYVKVNAHEFLSDYKLSIWVDGNILIKESMSTFLSKNLSDDKTVYISKHPLRTCIYAEASAVANCKKDTWEIMRPQIDRYKTEGFPQNFGLPETNVIIRYHNDEKCIQLMEAWWHEIENGSHRDQLSFSYCWWKLKFNDFKWLDEIPRKSTRFKCLSHGINLLHKPSAAVISHGPKIMTPDGTITPKPARIVRERERKHRPIKGIRMI